MAKWVKQYSTVQMDSGEVLTAKQVKEPQKRNAQTPSTNSASAMTPKHSAVS